MMTHFMDVGLHGRSSDSIRVHLTDSFSEIIGILIIFLLRFFENLLTIFYNKRAQES